VAGDSPFTIVTMAKPPVDEAKAADVCSAMSVVDVGAAAVAGNAAQYTLPSDVRATRTVNDTAQPPLLWTDASCTHSKNVVPGSREMSMPLQLVWPPPGPPKLKKS
jgi:hypothetical protein